MARPRLKATKAAVIAILLAGLVVASPPRGSTRGPGATGRAAAAPPRPRLSRKHSTPADTRRARPPGFSFDPPAKTLRSLRSWSARLAPRCGERGTLAPRIG